MAGWFKAACQVRITKAVFDFSEGVWSVEGYLDMIGPKGSELISSKMFKHSWHCDSDGRDIRKMVEDKVGVDLFAQSQMWDALSKSEQQFRNEDMRQEMKRHLDEVADV